MKILLCGYMGCGKSLIGSLLAEKTGVDFADLDREISTDQGLEIPEIFKNKGEISFRKTETRVLESYLDSKKEGVLALGGGTPCYGNNLNLIKETPKTVLIYLKMDLGELTTRLFAERKERPLIRDIDDKDELEDFIRKHLFERQFYYLQSDHVLDCAGLSPEAVVEKIEGALV